jgi:hypothetical protein
VQVYVDDIVFGGSSNSLVARFAEDMSREFEMSMMGELQFFLGCDAPSFCLASLTLMTESPVSNRLTLVKPRSNWVITSKKWPNKPY